MLQVVDLRLQTISLEMLLEFGILWVSINFYGFPNISIDFYGFQSSDLEAYSGPWFFAASQLLPRLCRKGAHG